MAKKRMISNNVVDTDKFLDMSLSTQALYFHFLLRADDDGFVPNPKRIMRMIGANEDEMKVLISKEYVIPFDTGVCVIKHWRIHNYIRKDRRRNTEHQEEKEKLEETKNGEYSLKNKECQSDDSHMSVICQSDDCHMSGEGEGRRGEVRKGEKRTGDSSKESEDLPLSPEKEEDIEESISYEREDNPTPNKLSTKKKKTNSSTKPKQERQDITEIINYLDSKMTGSLDGTRKENRIFAHNLIRKVTKDFPDTNPVQQIKLLIDAAVNDPFHAKNATNIKYFFYNTQKIIQSVKTNYPHRVKL